MIAGAGWLAAWGDDTLGLRRQIDRFGIFIGMTFRENRNYVISS